MVAALVVTALALGLVPGLSTERPGSTPDTGPPCQGVVVVVDTAALPSLTGGPSSGVVACATRDDAATAPSDGIEVLGDAGVLVEGTAQWGAAFVCRVDGRPAASEEIALPGGGVVTERCDRTPSTEAYWSLWTATPGSDSAWTYAQTGVKDMELAAGAALGLVFSVGPDAPDPPALSVADARAGRAGDGWAVRPPADGTAQAERSAPEPQDSGDALLLGVAAGLVLVLGGASVVLARRRR